MGAFVENSCGGRLKIKNGTLKTAVAFSDIRKGCFVSQVGMKFSDNASPHSYKLGGRNACKVGNYYAQLTNFNNSSYDYYPCLETYKFEDGELKLVKSLMISTTEYSTLYDVYIEAIDDSHVLCLYYGMYCVLEISDNGEITIVVGETTFVNNSKSYKRACCMLDDGSIGIVQNVTDDAYMRIYKCMINTDFTLSVLGEIKSVNQAGSYETEIEAIPMRNNKVYLIFSTGTSNGSYTYNGKILDFSEDAPVEVTSALQWTTRYKSERIFAKIDTSSIGLEYDYVISIDALYDNSGNYGGVFYQIQYMGTSALAQTSRASIPNSSKWITNNTPIREVYLVSQIGNVMFLMNTNNKDGYISVAKVELDVGTKRANIENVTYIRDYYKANVNSINVIHSRLQENGYGMISFPVGLGLGIFNRICENNSDYKIGVSATHAKADKIVEYFS